MLKYYCDRCGYEMSRSKYESGYRIPDPDPHYNSWDDEEITDTSLILCEVCKRAYITFIKEGKVNG